MDAAVERYRRGGTVRSSAPAPPAGWATLDAAELPPTFSADPLRTVAHHAGGAFAISQALENVEDDPAVGREAAVDVTAADVAIGLAASGRTPFVVGALQAARAAGAFTVLVSSAPHGPAAELVDVHVFVDTGPEAIAGSTRLKAGTAQKLVLNGFSTALMIRLGKTYSNLMVDVSHHNAKLRGRVLVILEEATGAPADDCARALAATDGEVKPAILCVLAGVEPAAAPSGARRERRTAARGTLRPRHRPGRQTRHQPRGAYGTVSPRHPPGTGIDMVAGARIRTSEEDRPTSQANDRIAAGGPLVALPLVAPMAALAQDEAAERRQPHRLVLAAGGRGRLQRDLRRVRGCASRRHRRVRALRQHRIQQHPGHGPVRLPPGPTSSSCGADGGAPATG